MSFRVRKLRLVEDDAVEAAVWYEEREPGLGEEFLAAVDASVMALARDADVRRAPVRGFKFYGIYYLIQQQEVWIIAVHHGRRHPRWLRQRRRQVS